jgi:hypothetical protein
LTYSKKAIVKIMIQYYLKKKSISITTDVFKSLWYILSTNLLQDAGIFYLFFPLSHPFPLIDTPWVLTTRIKSLPIS